jgi:transposase-like protein
MHQHKVISAEVKAEILRELLENQVPASELSERYGVNINSIYNWRKQLFEGAVDIFSSKHEKESQQSDAITARLEKKLREKDSLIADLVQDNIALKKRSTGLK